MSEGQHRKGRAVLIQDFKELAFSADLMRFSGVCFFVLRFNSKFCRNFKNSDIICNECYAVETIELN